MGRNTLIIIYSLTYKKNYYNTITYLCAKANTKEKKKTAFYCRFLLGFNFYRVASPPFDADNREQDAY